MNGDPEDYDVLGLQHLAKHSDDLLRRVLAGDDPLTFSEIERACGGDSEALTRMLVNLDVIHSTARAVLDTRLRTMSIVYNPTGEIYPSVTIAYRFIDSGRDGHIPRRSRR